ncbi:MAG: glycoside hydrolase family 5 protein [Oscillospiraceae bacterium]|jgi:endoglucanase|nr:glycoside hydrolase family 5 protein [Oscillospiraceae bacterium]
MFNFLRKNKQKLLVLLMIMTTSIVFFTACENDEPAVSPGNGDNPQDTTSPSPDPNNPTVSDGTPFERYGILQILNGQLCDERGNPVQLKGMSSFGLQWSDGYWVLTDEAFDVLANDWECDIIRLAMYVTEGGYRDNPSLILERVERGIELATVRGLYVMIDWHVLTPGNPNDELYLTAGLDDPNMPAEFLTIRDANPSWTGPQVFFAYLAQKYAHQGNVLYETANEPNRIGNFGARFDVWTNELKPYHESIIEVIREHDKAGIIICGTDNWSQFVDAPIEDPLDDPNVMYAMHFYAGTHDDWLRDITDNALNNGLAVFVTEWGASTASGDGGPYIYSAIEWNTFMNDRNLSWAAWSMAQKYEISAAFNHTTSPYPDGAWEDSEVSIAGRFYRAMIKGDPVPMYTEDLEVAKTPSEAVHNGDVSHLPPDDPGNFISLPFTFESGTREGWGKEGGSKIELSALFIGVAETQALGFHFTFTPDESRWEDGARLGSPHFPNSGLNLAQSEDITAFTMEVFVEDGAASKGLLRLATVIVPDGSPYWFEVGENDRFAIDPVNGGELITNPNGLILRKFTINIPFSISDYPTEMRPRNFVLALYNDEDDGSDFSGLIFYDNIGFVFD